MDKLGDIDLFVRVVKNKSFIAAAREKNLSPSSITVKINRMEEFYNVRLLNRTTRQVTLTEEGRVFYERCLRILGEVKEAEEYLKTGSNTLSGPLNITTTFDLGQQHIAPLLANFSEKYPEIKVRLHLNDGILNLMDDNFDIGVRFGIPKNNRIIARKLANNRRVLCASPDYLKKYGAPKSSDDLKKHRCLTMIRKNEPSNEWYFKYNDKEKKIIVNSVLSSNSGAQIKSWAIDGYGIALKSIWDIQEQLKQKKLCLVLDHYTYGFEISEINAQSELSVVYPSRKYQPERARVFIKILLNYFGKYNLYQ